MKITAYMNLLPTHIKFDAGSRTVALVDRARALEIYPDLALANSALDEGRPRPWILHSEVATGNPCRTELLPPKD